MGLEKIRIDETGNRYGRLVVLEFAGRGQWRRIMWKCKCDCGRHTITTGSSLRSGKTQSCGCLAKEKRSISVKAKTLYREIHGYTCSYCGEHKNNNEFRRKPPSSYNSCCKTCEEIAKLKSKYLRNHPGSTAEDWYKLQLTRIEKQKEKALETLAKELSRG